MKGKNKPKGNKTMNEKIKNNEISEENLEQVNGGRRVVVGDGKMGTCKKCGTYAYIIDGRCEKCRNK